MIDQKALDEVADSLVATGVRVTYESLLAAFKERNGIAAGTDRGKGHSFRDLQAGFDDWKVRRRYKPHLATRDIPERAEKAVALSLDALRKAAGLLPVDLPPMTSGTYPEPERVSVADLVERLERRLDGIAAAGEETARGMAALAVATRRPAGKAVRDGRKTGVAYATSIFFWDKLMRAFRDAIKTGGPMTSAELLALVDDDAHALAAAAFEPIDETVLREKLGIRVKRNNFFKLEEGRYHLLPRKPGPAGKGKHRRGHPRTRPEPVIGNV